MKTKFYWVALLASAALIAQAQAGGHHGGGGGHSAPSAAAPARGDGHPSFHSMPARNFSGGRTIYSGRRFSPGSMGQFNRGDRFARFGNNSQLAQGRNGFARRNGAIQNRRNGTNQLARGNNLPANWQNHVAARHSANWHRDWDRSRDHRWHGHHCRFINGSWAIFDLGFYPWWSYGYPYDYYGYDYYPYGYDPGYYYDSGAYDDREYYDQNGYGDQDTDSTVAAVQERLARQGYYRGEIDGVFGPQTHRAIARYQSNHGQRATGSLTSNTLQALGLGRVASY